MGFAQNFLSDVGQGFFGNDYLRDFQHASKTFRSDNYAYAPKFKFLFHVYFDINKDFIPSAASWPSDANFGLAVKSVQLPKYSVDLTTLNQYNRNRVVQTKIKYDPVNIVFHDDNNNLIRKMWYTYYTYYYKDATQRDGSNEMTVARPGDNAGALFDMNRRSIYDNDITGNNDWGYIGESGTNSQTNIGNLIGASKTPFFRAINIYGFNQHNFVLYRLINPIIESFSHDTYDYTAKDSTMEHQMTLRYETVKYYQGAVSGKTPAQMVKQFGDQSHYDTMLSPISKPGSNATILGQGGLLDAAGGIMDDLENGNILGAIQKAGTAKNTFKNPQNILKIAKGEALGGVTNYLAGTPNRNNLFSFPTAAESANSATSGLNKAISRAIGK